MIKSYKGWGLMRAIANGEIKKNQRMKMVFKDKTTENYIFDGHDIVDRTYNNIFQKYGTQAVLNAYFEIIEDKINIEEYTQEHTERCIDVDMRNKINELINAVNQINERLEKLEEEQ